MRRGMRSWLMLLLGLGAFALAVRPLLQDTTPHHRRITLSAGPFGTTRALVARALVHALDARGIPTRLVELPETAAELAQIDAGAVDFALVSEAYRGGPLANVREVTPLYLEALHLLVKSEIAAAMQQSYGALEGRVVDLGPPGSTTAGMATAVLAFAGLKAGGERAYVPRNLEIADLERLLVAGDRATLPDAVLELATLPSEIAMQLVRGFDYRLVPLPFAEALRLDAVLQADGLDDAAPTIERQHLTDAVIPAFTYRRDPAVPADALRTIGARLVLVANAAVPPETVEAVLETLFSAQVSRLAHPPLEPKLLDLPAHLTRHPGTLDYERRDKPFVTENMVDTLSSSASIVGAVAGGLLFLWQWWRQRRQAARDERFAGYLRRMADVERRMTALELAATLDLEPLVDLQREVLTLKGDVLERFAADELGDRAALGDLLVPLNATRDHIGDLILHVRTSIEDQAQAEGRSATALWTDAIDEPEPPKPPDGA